MLNMAIQDSILKRKFTVLSNWDLCSVCLIFTVLMLQVLNWFRFPSFLDCYYHLCVVRGFEHAGGWVGLSFWEYAPSGRPHLYPPLFHILELTAYRSGFGLITVARIFECLIYPVFLYSSWKVVRSLFTKEVALFFLLFLVSSYPLYLAVVSNIPSTIALIFVLLAYYFLETNRPVASILSIALSFYSHPLMPWIGWGAIFIYSLFVPRLRRIGLWICFWSVFLASPMLYHEIKYFYFSRFTRVLEFFCFEINPVAYILSFFGIASVINRKGRSIFFAVLIMVMFVLFFTNRDRFLSGPGLLPISFLAAFALSDLYIRLRNAGKRSGLVIFFLSLIILLFVVTPVIISNTPLFKPRLSLNSWLLVGLDKTRGFYKDKAESFYDRKLTDELVGSLRRHCGPDDILFSNYNYGAGMVAALSDRATSTGMLYEVLPFDDQDPVSRSRIVLWFKEPDGIVSPALGVLVKRYGLKKVDETGLACLYVNEKCGYKKRLISAKVTYLCCVALLLAVLMGILFADKILKKKLT